MTAEAAAPGGAWPPRRAVLRWALRLARQEGWPQLLLLGLLAVTTAGAVAGLTAAHQIAPASALSEFGRATTTLRFEQTTSEALALDTAGAREFGDAEVIASSRVEVPGRFEPLELRRPDATRDLTGPLFDEVTGRLPRGPDEVALTDDLVQQLDAPQGTTLVLPGEPARQVVGIVENPTDLGDSFAMVTELPGGPDAATIYIDGTPPSGQAVAPSGTPVIESRRGTAVGPFAAGLVLVATTVVLLLVSLVAAAGFAVVAQRRTRQLGLLAAIGGTRRQLTSVMTGHGMIIGTAAATLGTSIALALWVGLADRLEPVLAHRIDQHAIPWPFVLLAWGLTIAATTTAAGWPARDVVRVPVARALSGRPDTSPPQTSADVGRALILIVAGIACLISADRPTEDVLALLSTVAGLCLLVAGTVALAAPVIGLAGRRGGRAPIATRLALRDLARHRRRSAAALAALSVVLAIAVGTLLASTSAIHGAGLGNLADGQLFVRIGEIPPSGDVAPVPARSPEDLAAIRGAIEDIAAQVDAADVVAAEVAVIPDLEVVGQEGLIVAAVTEDAGDGLHRILDLVHVASDPLLRPYDLSLRDLDPDTRFLTTQEQRELFLEPIRPEPISPQRLQPSHTSLPGTFITPEELDRRGWHSAPAGWIIRGPQPLTPTQEQSAIDRAADAGLTVETRTTQADLRALRDGTTAVAALACLIIIGVTTGLVRTGSSHDRRTLGAIGSTRRQQRRLAATTATTLALLAVGLGTSIATVAVLAQSADPLQVLSRPPLAHLATLALGVPLVMGILTWWIARPEG